MTIVVPSKETAEFWPFALQVMGVSVGWSCLPTVSPAVSVRQLAGY